MLNKTTKWLQIFLIACTLHVQVAVAKGLEFTIGIDEVDTPYGKLAVKTKSGGMMPFEHYVSLNGNVIFKDSSVDIVHFIAAYPDRKDARLVLLQLTTGGVACPAFYRVIDIRDTSHIVITKVFGNCSDLIDVTYKAGSLYISMPSVSGEREKDIWRYKDGVLSELTKSKEAELSTRKVPYFREEKRQTVAGEFTLTVQEVENLPPANTIIAARLYDELIFKEKIYSDADIAGTYPIEKTPFIVLLQVYRRPSDCPGMYKIIEFKENGVGHITKDFGNCNDTPAHGMIYENGRLIVPIPPYLGRLPGEDWIYENGRLTRKKWKMPKNVK